MGAVLGSESVSSFTCLATRPGNEALKTHVTMPRANGEEWTHRWLTSEVERDFQEDMSPLDRLEMNMVKRAKTMLFSVAKELAKGNRRSAAPRWIARPELFLRFVKRPSYLSVGPRRLEGIGVEEITETAKKYISAKQELVSDLVHAQRALHTP